MFWLFVMGDCIAKNVAKPTFLIRIISKKVLMN